MKLSMTMIMTRDEYNALCTGTKITTEALLQHLTFIPKEDKLRLLESVKGELSVFENVRFKAKNPLCAILYSCGLKDEIELVLEIDTGPEYIKTTFAYIRDSIDIFGPLLNGIGYIINTPALKRHAALSKDYYKKFQVKDYHKEKTTVKL